MVLAFSGEKTKTKKHFIRAGCHIYPAYMLEKHVLAWVELYDVVMPVENNAYDYFDDRVLCNVVVGNKSHSKKTNLYS